MSKTPKPHQVPLIQAKPNASLTPEQRRLAREANGGKGVGRGHAGHDCDFIITNIPGCPDAKCDRASGHDPVQGHGAGHRFGFFWAVTETP